jgi:hypothetical protein
LNRILEEQRPNDPFIFGCYSNEILANVNYAIIYLQINDLHAAIHKATKMEEYMLEIDVDPKIILGKVQGKMASLSILPQGPYTSRSSEN